METVDQQSEENEDHSPTNELYVTHKWKVKIHKEDLEQNNDREALKTYPLL
jgi:hypothetical protein